MFSRQRVFRFRFLRKRRWFVRSPDVLIDKAITPHARVPPPGVLQCDNIGSIYVCVCLVGVYSVCWSEFCVTLSVESDFFVLFWYTGPISLWPKTEPPQHATVILNVNLFVCFFLSPLHTNTRPHHRSAWSMENVASGWGGINCFKIILACHPRLEHIQTHFFSWFTS